MPEKDPQITPTKEPAPPPPKPKAPPLKDLREGQIPKKGTTLS